jgi:hypothetical protein
VSSSFFFSAPAKAPGKVCCYQPVASTMVAPFLRRSMAIMIACFVPSRGVRSVAPVGEGFSEGAAVFAAFVILAVLMAFDAFVGALFAAALGAPFDLGFAASGSMPLAARPASVIASVTQWPAPFSVLKWLSRVSLDRRQQPAHPFPQGRYV